ncbi:MAG: FkbM family methyltransferase [Acidobacteria bacterium]|nr:MAG: FkbM family methyltransferase [Acidobacteriota bacterium]
MNLARLLDPRRYARARRIFRRPLGAHTTLAFATRASRTRTGPLALDFRRGGRLVFPRREEVWAALSHLLEDDVDPESVETDGRFLRLTWRGRPFEFEAAGMDLAVFWEIFRRDAYRLSELPGHLGAVVDVGGNVGLFTSAVAGRAERVLFVEPVPANRERAAALFARQGIADRVEIVPLAAGARTGDTVELHLSAVSVCHSTSRAYARGRYGGDGTVRVRTVAMADLLERLPGGRCDLMKIDAEGAEYDFLLAASPDALRRVRRLAVEVHVAPPDLPLERFGELRARLESAGFTVEHEPPGPPAFMLFAGRAD